VPAAHASIGLTAFLEYKARVTSKLLTEELKKYLENPAEYDRVDVNKEIYQKLA